MNSDSGAQRGGKSGTRISHRSDTLTIGTAPQQDGARAVTSAIMGRSARRALEDRAIAPAGTLEQFIPPP